jgi:hypothetical protein
LKTENKYNLLTVINEKAITYEVKCAHNIYNIALEDEDVYKHFGVYANGLLVEACSIDYLKKYSGMTLIE